MVEEILYDNDLGKSLLNLVEKESGMCLSDILKLGLVEEYVKTYLKFSYNSYCIDLEVKIYYDTLVSKSVLYDSPKKLSLGFLEYHMSEFNEDDLVSICRYQILSEEFIDYYKEELPWSTICQYQVLSESFMESHFEFLPVNVIAEFQKLSEGFIWLHRYKLFPEFICSYQIISESFIDRYLSFCPTIGWRESDILKFWKTISMCQDLSENFIYSHSDVLDWDILCRCQNLSEEFIWKNFAKINIDNVLICQKLSEDFIERYLDLTKDGINLIMLNQKISLRLVDKYKDYIDWYYLSNNINITEDIIDKYRIYLSPLALKYNLSSVCDKYR